VKEELQASMGVDATASRPPHADPRAGS